MRQIYALLLLTFLYSAVAVADCEPKTRAAVTDPGLRNSDWHNIADLSFRLGRDHLDYGTSTLVRRFDRFPSRIKLFTEASHWFSFYPLINRGLPVLIETVDSHKKDLQRVCRAANAAFFDDVAFDRRQTNNIEAARTNLTTLARDLQSTYNTLDKYSSVLQAAARFYTNQRFSDPPQVRLGPNPSNVAARLDSLSRALRSMTSDLREGIRLLPREPTADLLDTASDLEVAVSLLSMVTRRAQMITQHQPDIKSIRPYADGSYLAARCPAPINTWLVLRNEWSHWKGGYLTMFGSIAMVAQRSWFATLAKQEIRFEPVGKGYFALRTRTGNSFLDINYLAKNDYFISPQPGGTNFGQHWRCIPEGGGKFRLSNRFLGEVYSIDTYNNDNLAIMARTGNFSAQYWTAHRSP